MKRYANRYGSSYGTCRHNRSINEVCDRCEELTDHARTAELPDGFGAGKRPSHNECVIKAWPFEEEDLSIEERLNTLEAWMRLRA